jgi:hypothetical protein
MANYFTPYAVRVRYAETGMARHRVTLRRSPVRRLRSAWRDLANFLFGEFVAA